MGTALNGRRNHDQENKARDSHDRGLTTAIPQRMPAIHANCAARADRGWDCRSHRKILDAGMTNALVSCSVQFATRLRERRIVLTSFSNIYSATCRCQYPVKSADLPRFNASPASRLICSPFDMRR